MSRYINSDWIVPALTTLIVLLLAATCATTTVKCWHRGGSVMKNAFDWPICVEVTRK